MFTLNKLLFGRYRQLDTFVHRLDARVKLLWAFAIMGISAFTLDPITYGGLTLYLAVLLVSARLPKETLIPAARSFLLLFLITFLLHVIFAPSGGHTCMSIIGINVSSEGIRNGLLYSYRILLFLMTAMLANLTTSPADMTEGIGRLIRPLRLIRVPVGEITAMIFIALRFIPVLADEARMIRAAQVSRGLRPGKGILGRIRSGVPIILPLFLGSIRRAEHLAVAIESRGYKKGIVRTSLRTPRIGGADLIFAVSSIAVLFGLVLLGRPLPA